MNLKTGTLTDVRILREIKKDLLRSVLAVEEFEVWLPLSGELSP